MILDEFSEEQTVVEHEFLEISFDCSHLVGEYVRVDGNRRASSFDRTRL